MYQLRQPPLDLFGDVVVTVDDLYDWVSVIAPRWLYNERAYKNYIRSYNVAAKVRAAKLSGQWHEIEQKLIDNIHWHDRLAIDVIT